MATTKTERYIEGIGRRKSAVARVRITPSSKTTFVINESRTPEEHFPNKELQKTVHEALISTGNDKKFSVSVHVSGGGMRAQAEAIRLGIARALIKHEESLRGDLKKAGFLKRDPRVKERKKFGLKKARKAPQWSKR